MNGHNNCIVLFIYEFVYEFVYMYFVVTVTATEIDANHPPIVRSIYFLSSVNLVGGLG